MNRSEPATPFGDSQLIDWLRLIRTGTIGPVTFTKLLRQFGSAAAALDALPELGRRGGAPALAIPSPTEVSDEIAALDRLGGRFVALPEPGYPALLRHAAGAPPVIAVIGGRNLDWSKTVGIVGARNASTAGRRMTAIVSAGLGKAGYAVVSGLARGVDAAAHRAALATGTVAVFAGGLDRIYPEENIPLAAEIVDNGGAILSEMPLGWEARARDFPRRNRIVSGLSLGVVVIEAAKRSGSLITARLALEQNREVFAVPGSPLDPRAVGANILIQQGAKLVNGVEDILDEIRSADPTRLPLFEPEDDFEPAPLVDSVPDDGDRARLLSALSPTPVSVDQLVADTGLGVGALQFLLMELDIAGRIERGSGQLVSLVPDGQLH